EVKYEKSYVETIRTYGNGSGYKPGTTSGTLETKYLANLSSKSYSDIRINVSNHVSSCSNSYAKISVNLNSNILSLVVGATHNYTTGFWGNEKHSDPESMTAYSVTCKRICNYLTYNSGKSYRYDGSDRTLPSGFSNKIWAFSSIINDGYPHLVKNYWQDSAKK
ncbi:MAG: hypothetical protein SOV27_02640, partial [Eubacteriales bacterium]|nr:hypothetical protein [Eubacteriales bacterium]